MAPYLRLAPLALLAALAACPLGCAASGDAHDPVGSEAQEAAPPRSKESAPSPSATTDDPAPPAPPAPSGPVSFRLLTYNVAGLPQGLSKSEPLVNTPQISPKLNPFDLVVVQEDFSYHDALVSQATHPHKSTPMTGSSLGDGLNTLSRLPFSDFSRTKWEKCNGFTDQSNDCLTPKGFTRFVLDLGGGRSLDFYDVHFDAGGSDADVATRAEQAAQLAVAITQGSAGRAVIVAGDTNMRTDTRPGDEATLTKLLADASLEDACRKLGCAEPGRIDRIMVRSSAALTVTAKSWAVETSFVDAEGNPLSDHEPVSVTIEAQ